jgi:hypothetical protein
MKLSTIALTVIVSLTALAMPVIAKELPTVATASTSLINMQQLNGEYSNKCYSVSTGQMYLTNSNAYVINCKTLKPVQTLKVIKNVYTVDTIPTYEKLFVINNKTSLFCTNNYQVTYKNNNGQFVNTYQNACFEVKNDMIKIKALKTNQSILKTDVEYGA